ncbi:MAG TPA: hypothetical protein DCY20_07675, partial [Firmicutes bacterium]|nr:hypothetical protein [Bacillota bacterium]
MQKMKKQTIQKGMSLALVSAIISSNVLSPVGTVQAVMNQQENKIINELEALLLETQESVESTDVFESTEVEEVVESIEDSEETEVAAELLINQVYGGGGKSETPFTHSFIEIYNPTDLEIDLSQYSIQYSSEGSSFVSKQLEGSLQAGGTYLIRCNKEETTVNKYTLTEDNTDLDWDQVIANKQYRIAIVKGTELLDGFDFEEEAIVDLLGAIESGEGQPGGKISKQKSLRRVNYIDTNDNSTDFVLVTYNDDSHQKTDLPPSLQNQFVEVPEVPEVEEPEEVLPDLGETIEDTISVEKIASYVAGAASSNGGVAEIVKYNADNGKFYVINGQESTVHIVSLDELNQDPTQQLKTDKVVNLKEVVSVDGFTYGDISSIDINTELAIIVAAVQEEDYTKDGKIVVMDYDGNVLNQFASGVQPDMVKMTKDGQYILTANEGEPRNGLENGIDPKGSITVVDYLNGTSKNIYFNDSMADANVLIRNLEGGASVDLEPEYIALSENGKTAYVALQENNAIATIDIATGNVKSIKGLGFKDHSVEGSGLDAANDGKIAIEQLPILGVYMPDGIECITIGGVDYIVTANEGDATEWKEFENVAKLSKVKANLNVDASLFKGLTEVEVAAKMDEILNTSKYDNLEVLTDMPNDAIYVLGGRSFSMWNAETMELVFDSGDDFEQITAQRYPEYFNVSNTNVKMDDRSRKKGPEPEDVKVGEINGRQYAFIGLERTGGVMMYDVTDPSHVTFANYLSTRDYSQSIAGDVAPEGLEFIPGEISPTGYPLLVVANEVSGTVAVNQINIEVTKPEVDPIVDINIFHTNDTHARVDANIGFAKFKEFMDLANEYTTAEGALVLDAGDTLHGTSFATLQTGESVAKVMNAVGYDAMAPGNHDFNYGQDQLTKLGAIANVEVLAGNVLDSENQLKYGDIFVKEIEGVKVGVFGLATPETAYKTNPNNVEGLDFGTKEEIIEETKTMVKMLKDQGVDMVIGLIHMGIDADSEVKSTDIATAVNGIDLIIDGHSHSELSEYEVVNDTIITSTGEHFKNVGLVTVQFDKSTNEIITLVPHQVSASDLENVQPDEEVEQLINEIKADQEDILNQVIGQTSVLLDGERSSVRNGHTNLGHLLTAAMLKETSADIALTNGGGIRASIQPGDITKGDVLEVLPFGNYIVTVEMTGQQIVDALNHGLVSGAGKFSHFAGMDVLVKEIKDAEGNVTQYEVVSVSVNGETLDLNKKYVVATNDFLAAGGDEYTMIAEGKLLNEFAALDEALIEYIQTEGEAGITQANQTTVLTVVEEQEPTPTPTPDTEAPVLTLNGQSSVTIEKGSVYTELGAKARDNVDGDVEVSILGTVDTSKVGTYTVTYTAVDKAGNKSTITRTVEVTNKKVVVNDNVEIILPESTIQVEVKGDQITISNVATAVQNIIFKLVRTDNASRSQTSVTKSTDDHTIVITIEVPKDATQVEINGKVYDISADD